MGRHKVWSERRTLQPALPSKLGCPRTPRGNCAVKAEALSYLSCIGFYDVFRSRPSKRTFVSKLVLLFAK